MASPVLNHLQVDALLPLPKEEHGHGHGQGHEAAASADLSAGFTRVPLTLCPPFSSEVLEYHVAAPVGTTTLSVCGSSFSGAQVKIDGVTGSLRNVQLPAGAAPDSESKVSVSLHAAVAAGGAQLKSYTVHARLSAASAQGEVVKIDHSAPVTTGEHHGHSHNGVPCTHDHGHSHAAAKTAAAPAHGHSHDGAACADPSHNHGHGHGAAAATHGHSHDGAACTDPSHDHGHHSHGHGHGHGHHGHAHDHGYDRIHGAMDDDDDDEDDEHPGAADLMKAFQSGGGGGSDGVLRTPPGAHYAWGQDGDTVTCEMAVPAGTKGKDVKVVIGAARLDVDVASDASLAIHGGLGGRVSRDESSWSLVDDGGRRLLVITIAKEGGERAGKWGALLA